MAKKGEKIIDEATKDDERLLQSVIGNEVDIVRVRGKQLRIKWTHPAICDWISSLLLIDGNDNKILAQSAALIVLGGFWKAHLFYWFLWRWYYYVKQYNAAELTPIIDTAQKKTAQEAARAYLTATILLTALSVTKKQMTKAEAERTLQEQRMDKGGKSRKSTE